MISLNLAKILRNKKETQRIQNEAVEEFIRNIMFWYHSKNRVTKSSERTRFITELKARNVDAVVFMNLAKEAGKGVKVFTEWEAKNISNRGAKTLAEIHPGTAFSIVLCIIRDFYAHEIAENIPREVAVKIVIEEILLRS